MASPKATADVTIDRACVDFVSSYSVTISRVTLYDDADNSYTAGDDTGYNLEIDCPYATQAIANDLGNTTNGALYGVLYLPYEAATAYIDPAYELGDSVLINGIISLLIVVDLSAGRAYTAAIAAPVNQEVDHEYPYLSK